MKVNILRMNFLDRRRFYSEARIDEIYNSKRSHVLHPKSAIMPETLTFMTRRINNKKLKHQKRKIEVEIRNKNYAN
jgi:hypothetical protein